MPFFTEDDYGFGIMAKFKGDGIVFINASGMMLSKYLEPSEKYIAGTSNLIAFEGGVDIQRFSLGLKTTFLGEQGTMLSVTGPGSIFLSSHDMETYIIKLIRLHQVRCRCDKWIND